ncbi:hypothetical protein [Cryobacterium zhongshanensis]|uniref:Uncharacterized protein n=1 Tax=Cryobacterium zhongshanensis TaxID=2928153 RepID=A0AA41UMD9_9MICO|nr:hypothetical protein [Cryobacterium zhongshanensis]MCI4659751.1 hypothetical protein [Cryobacterium zhongshanensis]
MTEKHADVTAQLRPLESGDELPVIDTVPALDALVVGDVIRNKRGHVWLVDDGETDGTEVRYLGAGVKDYRTGRVLLEVYGPFTLIFTTTVAPS